MPSHGPKGDPHMMKKMPKKMPKPSDMPMKEHMAPPFKKGKK